MLTICKVIFLVMYSAILQLSFLMIGYVRSAKLKMFCGSSPGYVPIQSSVGPLTTSQGYGID